MGLDVTITREVTLSNDYQKGESIIKRNIMYQTKGWELGEFLIQIFNCDNCVPVLISDPEGALLEVDKEIEELNYEPSIYEHDQEQRDVYIHDLKSILDLLTLAKRETRSEWRLELSW
tara:strand:- start:1107 stop:1460 length:354 start_codon:yes stop_codon:yes gene_type:complete